jgi:ankyrin repeat protein
MCGSLVLPESNPLFALLKKEKWDRAVKEARRTPSFAKETFQVGGFYENKTSAKINALHLACGLRAPPEVIQALVAVHPDAVSEVDSRYRRLPLHIAVMNGASPKTVNALLELNPKTASAKDILGRIPLHYACKEKDTQNGEQKSARHLIQSYPGGALVSDTNGFLPLHVACRCGTSLTVIRMLIQASPESMFAKTKKGSTPAICAKQHSDGGFQANVIGILERCAEEGLSKVIESGCFTGDRLDGGISQHSGFTASVSSHTMVSR